MLPSVSPRGTPCMASNVHMSRRNTKSQIAIDNGGLQRITRRNILATSGEVVLWRTVAFVLLIATNEAEALRAPFLSLSTDKWRPRAVESSSRGLASSTVAMSAQVRLTERKDSRCDHIARIVRLRTKPHPSRARFRRGVPLCYL